MQVLDIGGFPNPGVPVIVNPRSGFPFGLRYRRDSLTATGGDLTIVLGAVPYDGALQILKNGIPLVPSAYSFSSSPNVVTLTAPTTANDIYTLDYFAATTAKPAASYFSGAWTPALLFASSQRGAYYDISDISTLFQDSGGTTPVTTAGQPVGKVLDKSPNAYHLTQSNSTSQRPTYQVDGSGYPYLQFSGSQVLYGQATGNVTLNTNSLTCGAAHKIDSGTTAALISKAYAAANAGRWWLIRTATSIMEFAYDKDGTNICKADLSSDTSTSVRVAVGHVDRSGTSNSAILEINASSVGTPSGTSETSNLNSATKYFRMGAFGDSSDHFNVVNGEVNYLNGRIYAAAFVFDGIVALNTANLTTWLGKKCGLTL